jgi:hypothetical protein
MTTAQRRIHCAAADPYPCAFTSTVSSARTIETYRVVSSSRSSTPGIDRVAWYYFKLKGHSAPNRDPSPLPHPAHLTAAERATPHCGDDVREDRSIRRPATGTARGGPPRRRSHRLVERHRRGLGMGAQPRAGPPAYVPGQQRAGDPLAAVGGMDHELGHHQGRGRQGGKDVAGCGGGQCVVERGARRQRIAGGPAIDSRNDAAVAFDDDAVRPRMRHLLG